MSSTTLKTEIAIRNKTVGLTTPVYVIGELACGHQGEVEQAKSLIDAVAESGADAVQLEFFHAPSNVVRSLPFYGLVEDLSFDRDEWDVVMAHARTHDIAVSAFIYDDVGLEWALDLRPDLIKLNSSDISNQDLIIPIAQSGIPFTLGTGASTMSEIARAVDLALQHGDGNIILQHGVQNFPTPAAEAHIRRISMLRECFGGLVMYADHTDAALELAQYLDLTAIGAGACAVEKHVVLDRAAEGVDWQAALEPKEFETYVEIMRQGSASLGPNRALPPSDGDEKYRRFQKKSIVAIQDIATGTLLAREHVAFLRAQGEQAGLSPMDFEQICGASITRDIKKDEQITLADVARD